MIKNFITQQILAFLIDNGFMRKNEPEKVIERLKQNGMDVTLVDARYTFYNATTTLHPKNNKGKEKKVNIMFDNSLHLINTFYIATTTLNPKNNKGK